MHFVFRWIALKNTALGADFVLRLTDSGMYFSGIHAVEGAWSSGGFQGAFIILNYCQDFHPSCFIR